MKLKRYLILFIFFILIPINVNAAYARLKTSNQTPVVNTEIEVVLEGTFDEDVNEAHYKITYDTNYLEYVENRWSQNAANIDTSTPGVILIDKETNGRIWATGNLAMMTFKVLSTTKTTIQLSENGTAYYQSGIKVVQTTAPITISAREPNNVSNIGGLYIEGSNGVKYTLTPTYSRTRYNYTLHVPPTVTYVNVVATKANDTQTITGDGKRELVYGDNKVKVVVTAQNGDTKTYEIMITREDYRTSDVSLKQLSISNTDIHYEEGTYTYDTTVSKSVDKVFISATPTDELGTVEGLGEKTLEFGLNTFTINVESSNGTTQVYTFNITRSQMEFQSDAKGTKLQSLKVNGELLTLEDNQYSYLYTTNEKLTEVEIEAITKSTTAKTKITGNKKIQTGANTISILVTETDGSQATYYVNLYRYKSDLREITDLTISQDQNTDDLLYLTTKQESYELPEQFIESMNKNKFNLYIGIIDEDNNLHTLIKLLPNTFEEKEIIYYKTDDIEPTYYTNLPEGTEITQYMGDLYDLSFLQIYSSQEETNYRELSAGTEVTGGYVTFTTDFNNRFTITDKVLVTKTKTILDYYNQYKLYIGLAGCVIIVLIFIGLIKKIKKKRQK